MKRITITVDFVIHVPDETVIGDIYARLDNGYLSFCRASGGRWLGSEVIDFTTMDVREGGDMPEMTKE